MREPGIKQLQYECNSFKRLIRFMADETVDMKNRMTDVLKEDFDRKMLDDIEYFQNEFISTDEIIGFIRNDITELDHRLLSGEQATGDSKHVRNTRDGLNKKIYALKERFHDLQIRFNDFLLNSLE